MPTELRRLTVHKTEEAGVRRPKLGCAHSVIIHGVQGRLVCAEASISPGLPGIHLVGRGDTSVRESPDRIRTAAGNSALPWPRTKIVVSLSPASIPKSGAHLDAAIVAAILAAGTRAPGVSERLAETLLMGEIGLDGTLRPVAGVIPGALAARDGGFRRIIVPVENAAEAALVTGIEVCSAASLSDISGWLMQGYPLPIRQKAEAKASAPLNQLPDFSEVNGQIESRFAAEVAATGGHHLMLTGPPGSGKSMIAARLPGILPELTAEEHLHVAAVHSLAGHSVGQRRAPYCAPHHSVSRPGLLGGGVGNPKPGAVSLAHHGVLFLDEASEIPAAVLDGLRTPLEEGQVRLSRADGGVIFPARFQLVLAANPCRCAAESPQLCRCSSRERMTYLDNLSGPLRDRIDIFVTTRGDGAVLGGENESSAAIRARVAEGREKARDRWSFHGLGHVSNALVDAHLLRRHFPANDEAMALLEACLAQGSITQRGVDRSLRLSWTLADLALRDQPGIEHMVKAMELHGEGMELAGGGLR